MLEPIIQPFVWGRGGRRMTPEEIARERELADQMGTRAGDTSPVGHWLQGAARVGDAIGSVIADKRADAAERQNADQDKTALTGLLGLLGGGSSMSPTTANVASALVPSGGGIPAQAAMVEGQPPVPGLQQAPTGASAESIRAGLVQRGLPEHVADAFVVNFQDESGLNPGINEAKPLVPGSRGGFGLYQLTGPRRVAYEQYAAERGLPLDSVDAQLDFMMMEGQGSEKRAFDKILAAPDKATAAQAIVNEFLRPAPEYRQQRAQRYASLGGGAQTGYVDPMVSVQPATQPAAAPAASGGIMDAIAPPMSADYFPPAPSAPQAGAIDPAVIEALSSPYASPQTKQVASMLLERTMSQQQQAQERALQEQQRAAEIQQRQAFLQANGLDPSIAMVDEAWAEAAKAPFRPRNTAVVNGVLVDAETGSPIYQAGPEPTSGMRDYDAYAAQVTAAGGTPLGRLEYEQALRASGAPRTEAAIPAGYRAVRDAQGNLMSYEPIPGGPAALEAQNAATAAGRKQGGQDTASDIVQSAALKAAQALSADGMPTTGTLGKAMSFLPESNAAEVRRQVAVLKANATLEGLNAMRASSPTGAALGSVTEGEGEKLAARAGTLDPDSPNFDRDLKDYTKAVLEYIHGPDAGREIYNSMQWGGAADASQSGDSPPAGVDPEDWKFMTPEERRLFQ